MRIIGNSKKDKSDVLRLATLCSVYGVDLSELGDSLIVLSTGKLPKKLRKELEHRIKLDLPTVLLVDKIRKSTTFEKNFLRNFRVYTATSPHFLARQLNSLDITPVEYCIAFLAKSLMGLRLWCEKHNERQ